MDARKDTDRFCAVLGLVGSESLDGGSVTSGGQDGRSCESIVGRKIVLGNDDTDPDFVGGSK